MPDHILNLLMCVFFTGVFVAVGGNDDNHLFGAIGLGRFGKTQACVGHCLSNSVIEGCTAPDKILSVCEYGVFRADALVQTRVFVINKNGGDAKLAGLFGLRF